jgi:hypothetical protein
MTFYVILGLFILGRRALYILMMRICGARFSVARLRETIFAFFVLILRCFSLLPWRGDERRAQPEAGFSTSSCIFYFNKFFKCSTSILTYELINTFRAKKPMLLTYSPHPRKPFSPVISTGEPYCMFSQGVCKRLWLLGERFIGAPRQLCRVLK